MQIVEEILENKSKIIFDKKTDDNIIAFHLFLPIGIEYDFSRRGIAHFVCEFLLKGTTRFTKEQLAYELEKNGIEFSWNRSDDYISYSICMHKDVCDETLKLFFHLLQNPIFPEEEMSNIKTECLNMLSVRYDRPYNRAFDLFIDDVYGEKHPYSWLTIGDENNLNSITIDEIKTFHDNYFISSGSVIVVSGDYEALEIRNIVNQEFLSKGDKIKNLDNDLFVLPIKKENNFIRKACDYNQAVIAYGCKAPSIDSCDFMPLKIINNYLGVGMTSRFFEIIRENLGLVYEVYSQFPSKKQDSYWMVYMGLDKKNVDLALEKLNFELQNFCIDEQILDDIKIKINSEYFLAHQTKMRNSWYLGLWEILGKNKDFDKKYIDLVNAVTKNDIDKTIKNVLEQSNKTVVVLE